MTQIIAIKTILYIKRVRMNIAIEKNLQQFKTHIIDHATISSILASKFNAKEDKKTCVFNIAKGQSAETINEVETIDYSSLLSIDRTISASEALASIMENYDYIFVDTAGDLSEETQSRAGLYAACRKRPRP